MNQITEALPRQEKWNASGIEMKKNKENPKKSFEDILKGRKETDVPAAFIGVGGEIVCPQMQALFFQEAPGKKVEIQNGLGELSSVSQIQEEMPALQQNPNDLGINGQPKEGREAVQNTAPENALGQTKGLSNAARQIVQTVQENNTETIQSQYIKNQATDSLETNSSVGTAGKEMLTAGTEKKSSIAKAMEERPVSAEDNGRKMQVVQGFDGHTGYVREAWTKEKAAPGTPKSMQPDMQDLRSKIIDQMSTGKKEFQVQLKPENLGMVLVKASYENGKAVISIVCMESKTMHAMVQSAEELGSLIQSRLGGPTEVVVETPHADYLEQQSGQPDSREQGQNQQQKKKGKAVGEDTEDFLQQLRLGLA